MATGTQVITVFLLCAASLAAQPWPAFRPIPVASGLRLVTDIQNAGDGSRRLFVVEQAGRILIHRNGEVLSRPFLNIRDRVRSGGERGLLGLAFPPGFSEKRYFYLNYTEGAGAPDLRTVIARYRVSIDDPDVADANSEERILVVNQPYDNHNAGQLAFGPDGYLYVGLGDGGSANDPMNNAQDPSDLLGKMLRIDVESGVAPYVVPATNPFVSQPSHRSEIWATGVRNPWRYSFDSETGDLWIADVGQNRFEEINFQPAASTGGENYGWKIMEAGSCLTGSVCNQQGLTLPVFQYGRTDGVSVTGGAVYRGTVHSHWQGTYFLADFGSGIFWGLRRSSGQTLSQVLFRPQNWAVSTFGVGEDGEVYVARYDNNGEVYRLADETPALRQDGAVNAATGDAGVVPGGRIVLDGWGVSDRAGFTYATQLADESLAGFRVWFNGAAGRIAELYNLGGREAAVLLAPDELTGETAEVILERNGNRSNPVTVPLYRVQPGLFTGVLSEAAAGSEITLLATGTGPFTAGGACGQPVDVGLDGNPITVLSCQRSNDYAGVAALRLQLPSDVTGELPVTLTVDGRTSPPLMIAVR